MNVQFVDLRAQYEQIKQEVDSSFEKLFNKGDFILGEAVKQFEIEFARYCKVKYALGVNSGTDALFLGLLSLGIKPGDEVIVPTFTFIATAYAVSMTGAKPVFVDVDKDTYNIDVNSIEKAINKKTKAIIPVHLYGQVADMQSIIHIAKKYNLKIVEDSAQAHGACFIGPNAEHRKAGSMGDVGCFSFYPTKNLGAFGDGGMVITNDQSIYERLVMLRDYGRKDRYEHVIMGYNSRLDSMQAIILLTKLKRLDEWNQARQKSAAIYNGLLSDCKQIILPKVAKYSTHVYHIYGVRIKNRDTAVDKLRESGIGVLIHYPIPLHLQTSYNELKYKKGDFPVAEKIANEIISLPMHPYLKRDQIELVADQIKRTIA